MLNDDQIKTIAAGFNVSEDDLKKAITSTEQSNIELTSPYKSFNEDQWNEYNGNLATENENKLDREYSKGKTVGLEKAIKSLREGLGLSFEGKTVENAIEAIKAMSLGDVDEKSKARIDELTSSLSQLREAYTAKTSQWEQEKQGYEEKIKRNQYTAKMRENAPDLEGISFTDFHTVFSAVYSPDVIDGQEVVVNRVTGATLKNELQSPISWEGAMKMFAEQKGWIAKPTGRGGVNESGQGGNSIETITTFEQLEALAQKNGHNPGSTGYNQLVRQALESAKKRDIQLK